MKKGISVIIPTYNRESFVGEAIQSVLDQEYAGSLEIIVSDDGSTDRTLEVAESFGNAVIILRKAGGCLSQGVSSTRNRGLKAASQPYISFLDSDDFYLPNHLNRITSVLEDNTDIDFTFCRMLEEKEQNAQRLFKRWTNEVIKKNDILHPVASGGGVVHTNILVLRRIVFDKVGYFNESLSNGEDGDLWMRISEQFKGAFVDYYGAAYRVWHGAEQLSGNSEEIFRKCFLMVYKAAIVRYYELDLKSSYRIFCLKHRLVSCKYSGKLSNGEFSNYSFMYYINYAYLIIRYPSAFFQKMPSLFYSRLSKQKKKPNEWHELSYFLKNENLVKAHTDKSSAEASSFSITF